MNKNGHPTSYWANIDRCPSCNDPINADTDLDEKDYCNNCRSQTNNQIMKPVTNQNFISVDRQTARNSQGEFFSVGETVKHQDTEAGQATIVAFHPEKEKNEIVVITDKGYAHLDFIEKI